MEEAEMKRRTVGEVMTATVVTVPESATYHELVDIMVSRWISAVPVVDAEGRVVGIVSEADLLHKVEFADGEPARHLLERRRTRGGREKAAGTVAADLMTSPAVTISPKETIAAAAALMSQRQVKRLPVVDADGIPVGIVSRRDLLEQYLRPDDTIISDVREQVLLRTMWMEPDSITVESAAGVVTLAGTVDRRSTVVIIEGLVHAVPGVVDVHNDLTYHVDDRSPARIHTTPVA
jgi:CBS domain-containing protein